MANLREAEKLTARLVELARELRSQAGEPGDFGRMFELADEIGASADSLAATLARVDDILDRSLAAARSGSSEEGRGLGTLIDALKPGRRTANRGDDEDHHELTREELYARARAAGIRGRSTMSRDELIEALRLHGDASD
jgi:hypothetical protein